MIKNWKKLSVLLFSLFSVTSIYAQETISATGSDASGSGGSTTYTIGQTAYSQNISSEGVSSEGVQQPFEVLVITSTESIQADLLELSAFPNPTPNLLTLSSGELDVNGYTYQLLSVDGILQKEGTLESSQTLIDLSDISQSTYLLKVISNNESLKTFKITKY